MSSERVDVLVVGGGLGGCAAALAAASLGANVLLTEVTDWLGGQLTSQLVPPDEHPWIESFGCTQRYRQLRQGIRRYYREHYPLTATARANPHLNPGQGSVSRLCGEPRVALAVLEEMLAWHRTSRRLQVWLEHEPVAVATDGDKVTGVCLRDRRSGALRDVEAAYVIDATELGDLLPLASVEYVTGAESQSETGEPHAPTGAARPDNQQAFTWCLALGYDPDAEHVSDPPASYARWRDYVPPLQPAWPGRLLAWEYSSPATLVPRKLGLFPDQREPDAPSMWVYRRIVHAGHYAAADRPHEVTVVNWPANDYLAGTLVDRPTADVERALQESRELSLSLVHWLQTEAPRPDGGCGWPGLYLRGDISGTADGLAKYPYVREARRIRAEYTITERDVGVEARGQAETAERYTDRVGVGAYRIDLHPSTGGDNYLDTACHPFWIPLGALLPVRVENLLPACKNLGTTHITNGCYRLHPVEWNLGEVAGALAAFCLQRGTAPRHVRAKPELLGDFQRLLTAQGVEIDWPRTRPL